MISYRYTGEYSNRERYREAYRLAVEYANSSEHTCLFALHKLNAQTLMNDIMGLSELKAVNECMRAFESEYSAMDEEDKRLYANDYDELWTEYETYYEKESARLRSLNIHASTDFDEEFRGRGARELISELAGAAVRWAEKPETKTSVAYTVDGREYTADEYGTLVDKEGIRSDMRVDNVGRLYVGDKKVGYFSTDGIFMPE